MYVALVINSTKNIEAFRATARIFKVFSTAVALMHPHAASASKGRRPEFAFIKLFVVNDSHCVEISPIKLFFWRLLLT